MSLVYYQILKDVIFAQHFAEQSKFCIFVDRRIKIYIRYAKKYPFYSRSSRSFPPR